MLPNQLRDFNVFFEGGSWIGVCTEIELPKLTKKMEDFYTGNGAVKLEMGNEALEATVTLDGAERELFDSYGVCDVAGLALRFAGAHETQDATCQTDRYEIVLRGRLQEIDSGTAKKGEGHQYKFIFAASYYKLMQNGNDVIEIDHVNYIERVNGVDRLAAKRAAIGI